jgi:hypothetical protein
MWRSFLFLFSLWNWIHCQEESGLSLQLFSQPSSVFDGRDMRRYLREDSPNSPLYRGFGTHFTYAWVGTPPRRVSLIVDTGSHHTAFPCKSCASCGKHTDHYWDPSSSSTSVILKCGTQQCYFSQGYTEGSSWRAYKVRDHFSIGGEKYDMIPVPHQWSVNFTFGCQTSETGLFRTQMENGIMGMSSDSNTLPHVLYQHKRISTTLFSLCLLQTGGVMSIGKINSDLHQSSVQYAALVRKSGYFTVFVETIFFKKSVGNRMKDGKTGDQEDQFTMRDLNEPKNHYNSGKGVIIDSGTTDTYLPAAIGSKFKQMFREMTGHAYSNTPMTLTHEELHSLPTFVYRLRASEYIGNQNTSTADGHNGSSNGKQRSKYVDIEFPPQHYLEPITSQKGKYIARLYLTERSGAVIGANMMTGYNIIFDQFNSQVGFAKSHCKIKGERLYDEVTKPVKISRQLLALDGKEKGHALQKGKTSSSPHPSSLDLHKFVQTAPFEECIVHPTGPCNARCQRFVLLHSFSSHLFFFRGPSRALGKTRTISPELRQTIRHYKQMMISPLSLPSPQSSVNGFYTEGFQRYSMNTSCVLSQYDLSSPHNSKTIASDTLLRTTNLNSSLTQFKTCYVPCDSPHRPVTSLASPSHLSFSPSQRVKTNSNSDWNPYCVNNSWSECAKDCHQTRVIRHLQVVKNSSGVYFGCQRGEFERRKCSKQRCLLNVYSQCAYILQMTLPTFDDRLWSDAWKDELIMTLAEVLQVQQHLPPLSIRLTRW